MTSTAFKLDKQLKGKRSAKSKCLYLFPLLTALCEDEDLNDVIDLDEAVLDFDDVQLPQGVT